MNRFIEIIPKSIEIFSRMLNSIGKYIQEQWTQNGDSIRDDAWKTWYWEKSEQCNEKKETVGTQKVSEFYSRCCPSTNFYSTRSHVHFLFYFSCFFFLLLRFYIFVMNTRTRIRRIRLHKDFRHVYEERESSLCRTHCLCWCVNVDTRGFTSS